MNRIFPFIAWFEKYSFSALKADAVAGLTVALVLIPQSMAYAQLAGLPPYYGLYAAFLPPMTAALFGSSRQLATGPVAVVSLITSVALEPLAVAGSPGYIAYAILLALMVGIFQFSLGALRLGLLVNFLSHPVINGFSNAAALIIASSQLAKMFGVYVDKGDRHYQTIANIIGAALHHTHWPTFIMGLLAFLLMVAIKRFMPKIPAVLVAVVVTTAISWATGFEQNSTVTIADIHLPKAHAWIRELNTALNTGLSLVARRAEKNRLLKETARHGDLISAINVRRDIDIMEAQLKQIQNQAAILRRHLRSLLFVGVRRNDQSLALHPRGSISEDLRGDGRTWRIRVGNGLLNTNRLLVTAGGEVVGSLPGGLPAFLLPSIDGFALLHLLPYAAIISFLGFMEAISIARAMAAQTGQRIDANQELIGQGLANLVGSLSLSYPVSGSFSRSAVNLQAGGVTGLSSVFTSMTAVAVLLFLTPLLYYLPQCVLAAVIMVAVVGLINVRGFLHAWRTQWYDGVISVITFVCTLIFAPHLDRGIIIGAVLSLVVFLYKSMRPTVVDLSLGVDHTLHDAVSYGLRECKYIDVVRFDGPLFYANASYLEDQIRERRLGKAELKHIIIVANGISDIDSSGEEALSFTVDRVRKANIDISLCGVNEAVMRALIRTHLLAKIGEDHVFTNIQDALQSIHSKTHQGGNEKDCPLKVTVLEKR